MKIRLFLFICFAWHSTCTAQNSCVIIEKRYCCPPNEFCGHKLSIHYKATDSTAISNDGYGSAKLEKLPDHEKLLIIGELLKFQNDTSLCCRKIAGYFHANVERTCVGRKDIKSTRFPLSIDALYMINKLAFPHSIHFYGCFPVLVDTLTNDEINDKPELISEVYQMYKAWYQECKTNGSIGKTFPFNHGRFVWWGGRREHD